jgi:chemotaxis family two-component system sensor kinase Cph1
MEHLELPATAGPRASVTEFAGSDPEQQIEMLSARIEELEAQMQAAESFAMIAAHELMAPLVMTEARVALVTEQLGGNGNSSIVSDLEALGRDVARSRQLVETLLDDARSTDRPLRPVAVALDDVVADCLRLLASEIEVRHARIEVGPMPEVSGQPELIRGLVTNLLVNALKFSRRSGSCIRMDASSDAGWWTVFVDDEAQPIPPEDHERIFLPYARGREERRVRGAGLGLAICQRIVERHGGRIGVTSSERGGNRFYFSLRAT